MNGSDDPIPCKLFDSFNGGAHITDGWANFVKQQKPKLDSECVLRFEKDGDSITVISYLV